MSIKGLHFINKLKNTCILEKQAITNKDFAQTEIGISTVRLTRIGNNTLYIQDIDILDGTPLLDIKPYVPKFITEKPPR